MPRVSIGLPVFNAGRYLRGALDSLLAQDYTDFELLISDNASTDNTAQICREYAAKDGRIRHFRNNANEGAVKNFNRVFELSSGEYFMWAAHDDLWAPTYVSECVAALDGNLAAVCACTHVVLTDEKGELIPRYDGHLNFDSTGLRRRKRVRLLLSRMGWFAIYGLIRSEVLKRCLPIENVFGADLKLMLQLSLLGPFVKVEKPLFFYRVFQSKTAEELFATLDPANSDRKRHSPFLTELLPALLRTIREFDFGIFARILLSCEVIVSFCFRNRLMSRLIGKEAVAELGHYYRQRSFARVVMVAPFCFLALPEWLAAQRTSNEQNLIDSYQRRDLKGVFRSLPAYVILAPWNLVRQEAWAAFVKILFKKKAAQR